MLKLLLVLALVFFAPFALVLAGVVLMPLLALLPVLFALGWVLFALMLVVAVMWFVFRVLGVVLLGVGGLMLGMVGFFGLFVGGALLLALGVALSHLLVPLLFVGGLIWLIRRASRAPTPVLRITHSSI